MTFHLHPAERMCATAAMACGEPGWDLCALSFPSFILSHYGYFWSSLFIVRPVGASGLIKLPVWSLLNKRPQGFAFPAEAPYCSLGAGRSLLFGKVTCFSSSWWRCHHTSPGGTGQSGDPKCFISKSFLEVRIGISLFIEGLFLLFHNLAWNLACSVVF